MGEHLEHQVHDTTDNKAQQMNTFAHKEVQNIGHRNVARKNFHFFWYEI